MVTTSHLTDQKTYTSVNNLSGEVEYSSPKTRPNFYTVLYNFYYRKKINNTDYYTNSSISDPLSNYLYEDGLYTYYIHDMKFDYTHKFSEKTKLRLGTKVEINTANNNTLYDDLLGSGDYTNSVFTGNEHIVGAYAQLSHTFSDRWSILASARLEYYSLDADLKSESASAYNDNFTAFPYLSTTYNSKNGKYRSSWAITSSISRPNFGSILSGERYDDEFTNSSGNPDLKPTRNYMFVWNQVFNSFSLYARYSYSTDLIGSVLTANPASGEKRYYRYENYADMHQFYANLSIPFSFFDRKLSGWIGGSAIFSSVERPRNRYVVPQGRGSLWRGSTSLYVSYAPTDRFNVGAYASYTPTHKTVYTDYKYLWALNANASYTLLKDRSLTLAIYANDLFNSSRKNRLTTYYDGNTMKSHDRPRGRTIALSINWKINRGERVDDKSRGKQSEFDRF